MGKRIVIKGADFSDNALIGSSKTVYVSADYMLDSRVNKKAVMPEFGPYAYTDDIQEKLRGKKINYIKFLANKPGVISILKTNDLSKPCSLITTVRVGPGDIGAFVVKKIEEFVLASDEWLAFTDVLDTGLSEFAASFGSGVPVQGTFYSTIGQGSKPSPGASQGLGFEVGYIDPSNLGNLE